MWYTLISREFDVPRRPLRGALRAGRCAERCAQALRASLRRARPFTHVAPPVSATPAAVAFINRSLDHWAGRAGAWHSRFTHHDQHHIERQMGTSGVVMERKKRDAAGGDGERAAARRFLRSERVVRERAVWGLW